MKSKNQNKNTGFILLVPLLCISLTVFSSAYILLYKVSSFEYALAHKEYTIKREFEKISCKNLTNLYKSYNPFFLSIC